MQHSSCIAISSLKTNSLKSALKLGGLGRGPMNDDGGDGDLTLKGPGCGDGDRGLNAPDGGDGDLTLEGPGCGDGDRGLDGRGGDIVKIDLANDNRRVEAAHIVVVTLIPKACSC